MSDEIAFQFGQSNTRSLYLLDIHHHLATQLARGTNTFLNYSWSPDGNGDLLLAQTDCLAHSDDCGSQAYNLTRSPFTNWYPVWSPDSQRLLFQSNRSRQSQVYEVVVNCDSKMSDCPTPLKSELSYSLYPSFSPDGHWIMLLSSQGKSQELYLLVDDVSSVQQLTHMGEQISSARWRPTAP